MPEKNEELNEELNDNIKPDDNMNDAETEAEAVNQNNDPVSETEIPASADIPAPAVEESKQKKKTPPENGTWKFLYPAVVLASISVITALLLAVLNSFTAQIIADRLADEEIDAIQELFGEILPPEVYSTVVEAPVNEILRIMNTSDEFLGYCVSASPKGFSGKINMLVAVNPDGAAIKIKILDMSETAGIGTNVESAYFLEQFAGKTRGIEANSGADNSIDTISGATVSSKAVLSGINAALEAVSAITGAAGVSETTADVSETETTEYEREEAGSTEGDGLQE